MHADYVVNPVSWLDRQEVVDLLESVGIACFDRESTEELREALRVNIEDGTIEL